MAKKRNSDAIPIKGAKGKTLTTRAEQMKELARRALIADAMSGNKPRAKVSLPKFSWDKKDDE